MNLKYLKRKYLQVLVNNRINSSSSSSSNNVFIYVLRRVNIIVRSIPLILTVHEIVVNYMEDGGMEGWVVEKGRGGI